MKKVVIGGEYYYSPTMLFKKKKFDINNYLKKKYPEKFFCFTGGGYYSIFKIIKEIGFKNYQEILLPSYLCPTILIPFRKRNIKYKFFKVKKNLEIDIEDLESKITKNTKAVFFINYFGFPPKEKEILFLKELKSKKIILIEDCVQSFFSNIELIGDYAFNSFRKFLPIDGSVIITDNIINKSCKSKSFTKYFFLKYIGQQLRRLSIDFKILDLSKIFLKLFNMANKNYYLHSDVKFNWWNKLLLSKFDINLIKKQRLSNYKYLLNNFKNIAFYKNIYDNIVPLGFPVLIGKNRDFIKNKLIDNNIFCPVHWNLSNEISKNKYFDSWYLSANIMTFPINENVTENEIIYLKQKLEEYHECLS